MRDEVVFHGTDGDAILSILSTGEMRPGADRKIFFSKYRWEDALMHGPDRRRGLTFVVKVRVWITEHAVSYRTVTEGVPLTLVVETIEPLRAEILELFVRKRTEEGYEVRRIVGADLMKSFLLL